MADNNAAPKKVTLKLLIDRKRNMVLFAEAGKDFVDFLFHMLRLPIGTVVRLLGKTEMVGSAGNLYGSIESLNDTYSAQPKDSLLKPTTPPYCWSTASSGVPLVLPSSDDPKPKDDGCLYGCSSAVAPMFGSNKCSDFVSRSPSAVCPSCGIKMVRIITLLTTGSASGDYGCIYGSPDAVCPSCGVKLNKKLTLVVGAPIPGAATGSAGSGDGGYVKGCVTYMVTEDLAVMPMSTVSVITLLDKLKVEDHTSLEEEVVEVGKDEGLALLKASLQSKTVLTDAFLARKRKRF